jgi:S-adenosylmethionine-diacylglycerol 3-amino-3-carboxypropyl transferase
MGDRLVFTRAWEDDRLDLAALAIQPGDRALVVAGAGDLALAAAAEGAAAVIAVDQNPAQLHLVSLKTAAAVALDAETRYRLLEVGRERAARSIYRDALRPSLETDAAAFWDREWELLEHGLHTASGVGRAFGRLGRVARFLAPSMARAIETARTPGEQLAYWRAHVRGRLFGRWTHWLFAHTPLLAPLAPNRLELRRMRQRGYSRALEARVDRVIGRTLIREHPWWRPVLSGRPAAVGHGAAWLDPERAGAVAAGAGRIQLIEGDLLDVLDRQAAASLDVVSVSNVTDWMEADARPKLRSALVRALAPGGRVIARSILEEDALGGDGLARDPISDELAATERTALYGRVDLLRPT